MAIVIKTNGLSDINFHFNNFISINFRPITSSFNQNQLNPKSSSHPYTESKSEFRSVKKHAIESSLYLDKSVTLQQLQPNKSRKSSENIINTSHMITSHNSTSQNSTSQNTSASTIPTHSIEATNEPMIHKTKTLKTIKTTCPYCGVGCGVLATVDTSNGSVSVVGDPNHPANFGKLCSKGSNLAQTLETTRRLEKPYYQDKITLNSNIASKNSLKKINENQQTSDWDTILDDVASRLSDTIAKHGRDSVMLYVSGQLLTEDYYVANKFVKGFIGNNNIDSNSRLCMSSAVAGHKRAFGADLVPGSYTDFENCDLLVLVGSNMAWCHPILFARFLKAKQENPDKKLIVIDPRRTDSCEFADLHLPLVAGSDTHLFNGLLNYLNQNGYKDLDYTAKCVGLDNALNEAKSWDLESVAKATQLDKDLIEQFFDMFATTSKTVTAFSMGVNQSSSGSDKVNAIINTHLITGRVGKEGASPFSLTGQPNAMGGREVGALANLLAGHLELDNAEHRNVIDEYWSTPQPISKQVGIKACDATDAILDGRIKAIWIMATNPVVSLPEAEKFKQALLKCDLVIVSECSKDSDTVKCADIVLPAQSWGEKSGTVTNSERLISRQRTLLPAVGESKPDWWIISQVAKRMGYAGFDYANPSDIFNEYAALTAFKNDAYPRHLNLVADLVQLSKETNDKFENSAISKDFNEINIGKAATNAPLLSQKNYDDMLPFQWGGKYIDVSDENFKHSAPSFISIKPPKDAGSLNQFSLNHQDSLDNKSLTNANKDFIASSKVLSKAINSDDAIKLRLITGRLRDQWHTMTRTGLAPKLNQQQSMPLITINSEDAESLGVVNEQFVSLSPHVDFEYDGELADKDITQNIIAQVDISNDVKVGDGFMPMHWSNSFANLSRVGVVIPNKVDPVSAQPELKNSAIAVSPLKIETVGRMLVHPNWLDSVLVQLSNINSIDFNKISYLTDTYSTDFETEDDEIQKLESKNNSIPNIVWSLTRQADCILINIATPKIAVSHRWLTADFWDHLIGSILTNIRTQDTHTTDNLASESIENSFVSNIYEKEFRLIVTDNQSNQDSDEASKQLMLAVYIAPTYNQLPSINWLNDCFADMSTVPSYKWLLAGRPASGYIDPGPIVCACMGVGENIIINAIKNEKCKDADSVAQTCKAGTNCGSCVGQINDLIKEYA